MESTNTVVYGVQALNPAALFRVVGGTVSACRPVSGQECFGFGTAVSRLESVSGATVPGAVQALGLRGYAGAEAAGRGPVRLTEQAPAWAEQVRPAHDGQREIVLAQLGDVDGGSDDSRISSDSESINGFNGTKPMSPWDLRSSSPPG